MEKKIIQEWREIADSWKRLCEEQEFLLGELQERSAVLKSNGQVAPKKKKRQNDIGLQVIRGGKGFEDDPPFAD